MKPHQIYYRRKEGKIIAEGKIKNKTIYLFQLPGPEEFIRRLYDMNLATPKYIKKSSLFTKEKQSKILEKINRLDYRPVKQKSSTSKVRTIKIVRTPKIDEK